jgi:hypothetical protein
MIGIAPALRPSYVGSESEGERQLRSKLPLANVITLSSFQTGSRQRW